MTDKLHSLSHTELINLIYENERTIASLKKDNRMLRHVIALIPGNIFWKDKNGIYLGCNNNVANILGLSNPNDIIGKSNNTLFDTQLAGLADQIDQNVYQSSQEIYLEEKGLNNHNEPAIYLTKKIPLTNDDGSIAGLLGVSLDITERKKIEEDLKVAKERAEIASQDKSEFVANMSHDIKTPLSGIIGLAELLAYRLQGLENREFAQSILHSGRQLLNFFDNCLEVFKFEAGASTLIAQPFQLNAIIHKIEELYQPSIKLKNLAFTVHYEPYLPEVLIGDSARVYRILLNLVGNAVKFTAKGFVSITVSLNKDSTPQQAMIRIIVEDSGIGIPENKQNIIFDKFTRLIPTYKGIAEGSGIGLYIVQRYVNLMQGQIQIKSQLGKGSQFIIDLPFQIPPQTTTLKIDKQRTTTFLTTTPNESLQSHQDNDDTQHYINVLLVEDNVIVQLMEYSLLTSLHCRVDLANCGEEAMEFFEPGKYDLIFLDIGLPGIQGDMVAKSIRKKEASSHHRVPIIALTAHTTDEFNHSYLASGIDRVISKPLSRYQARELLLKIRKTVGDATT